MGFSEAVQWWEEWKLRILVLASVSIQCFLFFAGILRKRCIPSWLRFLIWLAYISSDAVAVYALATLFNCPRKQEWVLTHQISAWLQMLWPPMLLIHLGGQDGIAAYNIEDNELWRRHVVTMVSQVAVAVYVFCNSFQRDNFILAFATMFFIIGILKCGLKPWELKRVSINSFIDSCRSEEVRSLSSSQEKYVEDATRYFQEGHGLPLAAPEHDEAWKPYDLFVDLTPHHLLRLSCLKALVHDPADKAHRLVRYGLSVTFDRLYTKESPLSQVITARPPHDPKLFFWISLLRVLLTVGAFLVGSIIPWIPDREPATPRVLASIPNDRYRDWIVTLILVDLVLVLELLLPPLMYLTSDKRIENARWPDQVAQYNLIGYLARNKKHKKSRRLATLLVCKDYIDQLWCMKPSKSSSDITELVHGYLARAWTEHHIKDMATYRAFNDNRGQWTLKQEGCRDTLSWSLERPFDESVLLWHLATDLCFHHLKLKVTLTPLSDETTTQRCRVMSNYMVHLLFVNPEMLMTGARRFLFREAYRQLKKTFRLTTTQQQDPDAAGPWGDESELAHKIAQNIQHARAHEFRFIRDAWRLAQQLQNLHVEQDNAKKMWRVVQGVWVEMLCFSAGRCRGYLHAKSLGKGGEFLSYIWLLMSYMGMETLAERMQRTQLKEQDAGNNNNGGSSDGTTTAAASSSSIATGGSANGTTLAATPVPARAEASLVTEGGRADGTTMPAASPVAVATTDPGGDGRTAASPATPSGDENV